MAGMRAVHKKNGTTFKYSGDLKETIEKAEKELKEKEGTTQWLFLKWQYDNARKAFEKYNRRLEDLKEVIDRGGGRYRYLTERECWRLMGYTDEDFDRAKAVQERNGKYYKALYDQAGNSIAVPIFESIFRKIILHEVA